MLFIITTTIDEIIPLSQHRGKVSRPFSFFGHTLKYACHKFNPFNINSVSFLSYLKCNVQPC